MDGYEKMNGIFHSYGWLWVVAFKTVDDYDKMDVIFQS